MPNGLDELEENLRRFVLDIDKGIKGTVRDSNAATLRYALKLSSGPHKYPALRRMGHPYAVWHVETMLPPQIINEQSGDFKKHWHTRGNQYWGEIYNNSKVMRFFEDGTERMVARPILDYVARKLEIEADKALQRHLDDIEGP